MMPGPMELVIVLVVALLIFGPRRLPELGRSLGGGMRSFKESVSGKDDDDRPGISGGPGARAPGSSQLRR
jgi:sec-independent protein translocase protein TatA